MNSIALEIETMLHSKYFLESLLTASIASACNIAVVGNGGYSERWVQTLKRKIYKEGPIPPYVLLLVWAFFDAYISKALPAPLEAGSHPLVRGETGSPDTPSSTHTQGD
jgi:hypothetical protein